MQKKPDHFSEAHEAQETIDNSVESILRAIPDRLREEMGHALRLLISSVRDKGIGRISRQDDSSEHLNSLAKHFDTIATQLRVAAHEAPTKQELAESPPAADIKGMVESVRRRYNEASEGGKHHFTAVSVRQSDLEEGAKIATENSTLATIPDPEIEGVGRVVEKGTPGSTPQVWPPNSRAAVGEVVKKLKEAGATEEEIMAVRWKHEPPRAG